MGRGLSYLVLYSYLCRYIFIYSYLLFEWKKILKFSPTWMRWVRIPTVTGEIAIHISSLCSFLRLFLSLSSLYLFWFSKISHLFFSPLSSLYPFWLSKISHLFSLTVSFSLIWLKNNWSAIGDERLIEKRLNITNELYKFFMASTRKVVFHGSTYLFNGSGILNAVFVVLNYKWHYKLTLY